jgi:hypothetical protein
MIAKLVKTLAVPKFPKFRELKGGSVLQQSSVTHPVGTNQADYKHQDSDWRALISQEAPN